MGLDMYAYAVVQGGQRDGEEEPLAEWRKHNRLHGWMNELWEGRTPLTDSNSDGTFNCIPVELFLEDLDHLEADITDVCMPETHGFFFGDDSFGWEDDDGNKPKEGDYYYKKTDLQFIEDARKAINEGKKVYYNSWW